MFINFIKGCWMKMCKHGGKKKLEPTWDGLYKFIGYKDQQEDQDLMNWINFLFNKVGMNKLGKDPPPPKIIMPSRYYNVN